MYLVKKRSLETSIDKKSINKKVLDKSSLKSLLLLFAKDLSYKLQSKGYICTT